MDTKGTNIMVLATVADENSDDFDGMRKWENCRTLMEAAAMSRGGGSGEDEKR